MSDQPQPQPVNLNELIQSALAAEKAGAAIGNWRDIALAVYNAAAQHVQGMEEKIAGLEAQLRGGAYKPATAKPCAKKPRAKRSR